LRREVLSTCGIFEGKMPERPFKPKVVGLSQLAAWDVVVRLDVDSGRHEAQREAEIDDINN